MSTPYAKLISDHADAVATWMELSTAASQLPIPSQEAADAYAQLVELSTAAYVLYGELEHEYGGKGKKMPKGALMI